VVAGGGPAGLSAAWAAARAGARVLLLEREAAFGVPTRTSGASFVSDLRALGIPEHLWTPVERVRFVGPTVSCEVPGATPQACVLDVRALYQWLGERAAAAGVELRLRTTVLGAGAGDDVVRLRVRGSGGERSLTARWAVDATGTSAVLAASVGMHPPFARRAVGVELDLAAPAFPVDLCVLAFGSRVAPAGYAWAFPYRAGRVRLGVGITRPDSAADPRDFLDRARALPGIAELLAGAQPIEVHAGLIPVEPLRGTVVRRRVICAGDSASHASTLAGEGIRYALGAGAAAGRAVALAALRDSPAPALAYQRAWRRRHARDLAVAHRLNRRLSAFDDAHWDRAVATLARTPPWFVATALRSDFRLRGLVRLAAGHPGLALRLLRAAA